MENQTEIITEENVPDTEVSFPDRIEGKNTIPALEQLILLGAILLLLFGGTIGPKVLGFIHNDSQSLPATPIKHETSKATPQEIKPFTEVHITGKSAYVWDVQTQRALYKKEETVRRPLASVTKLMTALVAHELLGEDSEVAISNTAIRQDGDSGLLQGETFDRETLSDLVLMSSSNDGAYALAAAAGSTLQADNGANAFVHAMNIRADELNLHETTFRNPTGLDISEDEGGAYGSAKDMAFLMEHIVLNEPDILESTAEEKIRIYNDDGVYHDGLNTNYYIDEIPGLIGSKTGYTELAGGNLVVAFNAGLNRPVIVVVLGSTRHERFTDVMALVEETQNYISQ